MARISLAICLTLLVTLSTVYETQGTFSLPHYLENFPKQGKDFEAFANKGMSDFLGDLEGKCPKTAEFKDLFAKLKDYMASFGSSKDIKFELSEKSEKLYRAMSVFDTSKGGTSDEDSWRLVNGLLSMGKGLIEMKKRGSQEMTFEQRKELIQSMVEWTRGVGLFVKTASENKGQSIDLSSFGIDYDTSVESPIKRAMYETQGTFSLPHYMENLPKMAQDFEPFAYNGMSHFIDSLESKCPATTEFKDFFVKLEDYMACFKSATSESKVDMSSGKSQKLYKAMSLLITTKGGTSVDSWRMLDGLLSMGKVVVEMKKHGSKEITFEQRKEVFTSMVKWARAVGLFAKMASEKKGKSIDLSAFGIDYAGSGKVFAWGLADTTLEDVFIKVARTAQAFISLS